MGDPRYAVKALDESTWAGFAALVERNNGVFGGCWCMAFHPEQSWPADVRERVPQKRAAKEQRVREGKAHAALVFDGEDCVGWCQFGTPDELPRIKSRAAYEKGRTTGPDWRIACCYSGRGHRRQGVAAAALAGALDLIASLGGGTVEGYPEPAGAVPAGFLYNGALSTYEKLGFIRDRPIGKHRWVVTRVVIGAQPDGPGPLFACLVADPPRYLRRMPRGNHKVTSQEQDSSRPSWIAGSRTPGTTMPISRC